MYHSACEDIQGSDHPPISGPCGSTRNSSQFVRETFFTEGGYDCIGVRMESFELVPNILWIVTMVISMIPLIIFFVAYKRVKDIRLLLTLVAFAFFFVKAAMLASKLIFPFYDDEVGWSIAAVIDIVIISLIALSLTFNKKRK